MRKRTLSILFSLIVALCLTGCSFKVGNVVNKEKYQDIFTDVGSSSKYKMLTYDFSITDHGSMKVYLDATEGHQFKVDSVNAGFIILDSDGNEVLHAYAMTDEQYEEALTINETKKYNNRKFIVHDNNDGTIHHAISYMGDVGIDLGMILEAADKESFKLVAFRGEPIKGYVEPTKHSGGNTATETNETTTEEEPWEDETTTAAEPWEDETTASSNKSPKEMIDSLQSDLNKINWGVRYSFSDDYPYLYVSVAPYFKDGVYHLMIALTNLYTQDILFTGDADAAEAAYPITIITGPLGCGNTELFDLTCSSDFPTGKIRWSDCTIELNNTSEKFVPWRGNYAAKANDSHTAVEIEYSIYGDNNQTTVPGRVTFAFLDENGNVLAVEDDYSSEEVPGGTYYSNTVESYMSEALMSEIRGVAMFASSVY